MRLFQLLILPLLISACAAGRLQPSPDDSPAKLLAEVDRSLYSPVSAGLQSMDANLLVDITGFFPDDKRPTKPVWMPVEFSWKNGRAEFTAPAWPAQVAPLKKRVLEVLQGKEEDLVQRPFSARTAGFALSVIEVNDGIAIEAVNPKNKYQWWRLHVGEDYQLQAVEAMDAGKHATGQLVVEGRPGVVLAISNLNEGSGTPVHTKVSFEYGRAGKYTLPKKIVYEATAGAVDFPPLTILVKNVTVR